MNGLVGALSLPPRLVARALDDLHVIAQTATAALDRLDSLDARGEAILDIGERMDARAEAILALGERIDRRADAILEMGERIDARAERILEMGEHLDRRGEEILGQGAALVELGDRMQGLVADATREAVLVHTRAGEVVASAHEMIAVLPTLERAVAMASPLEGLVERLGRAADRLPGGNRRD